MKITIDARKLAKTGIGVYIKNLIKALADLDQQNEYLLLTDASSETSLLGRLGNNFQIIQVRSGIFSALEQLELPWLLKRAKVDLFHSTHFFLPLVKTCPCLVTIHDLMPLIFPDNFSFLAGHYLARMIAHAVRQAEAVIAVSHHTKADVLKYLPQCQAQNIQVIYEAPDHKSGQDASMEILSRAGLTAGRYLLYVGSDKHNKNLPGLLAAYAQLGYADKYPLALAGKIDARSAAGPGVKLLGVVSDSELDCLYSNARLFVMPSFYEGFGLPVLEAMAQGIPVVTAQASSTAEIAGEAAWLVRPESVTAIAVAMAEATTNEAKRAAMIKKGLSQAAKFSWAKAAQATLEVYRETIKRR